MSGNDTDPSLRQSLLQEEKEKKDIAAEAKSVIASKKSWLKAQKYWDEVDKTAESLMNKGMEGYVEWTTGAMEIFNAMRLLNRALEVTFEDNRPGDRVVEFLAGKTRDLALWGVEKAGLYTPKPEQKITYSVNIDKEGKLETAARKDGLELTPEQNGKLFKVMDSGLALWLQTKGYKIQDQKVVDENTNEPLTAEKFKEIDVDDDTGLNAFFEGRFEMPMKRTPTPTSTTPSPS